MPSARSFPLARRRWVVGTLASVATLAGLALTPPGIASAAPKVPSAASAQPAPEALTAPTLPGKSGLQVVDGKPHTVTYDKYSLAIDGTRVNLWSGEFHYWRLPSPSLWRDVLQKMKAAGYNATSIYFDWDYHSPAPGIYNFKGVRNVDELLDIAAQVGIYVIARPGPYINAETDSGGYPGWLTTIPGRDRSLDPSFINAADEWYHHIDPIIARHQVTNGTGSVILFQIDNEWGNDIPYFSHLIATARADGITVPTFHNDNGINGNGRQGDGGPDLYAFDNYPLGFNCGNPTQWNNQPLDIRQARQYSPTGPLFVAEFQGGAFDPWGGVGYDKCRQLTGPDFEKVYYENNTALGATAQNFYMTYGGTSWGWLPAPSNVYTSYDYGAAITEGRQLTDKYTTMKNIGYLLGTVGPLTKTDDGPSLPTSNSDVQVLTRVNPDTGTQLLVARHVDATSTADDSTTFPLTTTDGTYPTVPQSGALEINGRDSFMLVADWDVYGQHLVYSTSEVMAARSSDGRDTLVVHGRTGQAGETVLRYSSAPTVTVLSGSASSTFDATRGDLRLDYTHSGLSQVLISGGGRPDLLLMIGDDAAVSRLWTQDTSAGSVIETGPELVRTATVTGHTLALTGDTDDATTLRTWAPAGVTAVTWNGRSLMVARDSSGALLSVIGGPQSQPLPVLTNWKVKTENAQVARGYDDSAWQIADRQTTNNPATPPADQPVLYADDYGFHHGDVYYRGHFRSTGKETSIALSATTGNAGVWSAWLNGTFLGSSGSGGATFPVPSGLLLAGQDNVITVLVRNMGHNESYGNNAYKEPRGLTAATISTQGSPIATPVTWRIQGNLGGEDLVDTTRGPLNNGGLYGERNGWYLPGYDDAGWGAATLPASQAPGVSWYRTTFAYSPVKGQDSSVALRYTDDPSRPYRALLFVNGWNLGQYVNNLGPQHDFVIPNGILHKGTNTVAIVSWAAAAGGGLGQVSLVDLGTVAGGVPVDTVASPRYSAKVDHDSTSPGRVRVRATPTSVQPGQQVTVVATYRATSARATAAVARLTTTAGWKVSSAVAVPLGTLAAGASATATWTVTAPADANGLGVFDVAVHAVQRKRVTTVRGAASVLVPTPPPTGTAYVSDLPFQSSNGWGPVERDHSNGENSAGDGGPITIAGTVYPKGLGVHAPSTVTVFLGGNCTSFSATVGVDDEVGGDGSVRFTVSADGTQLAQTGVLRGTDPAGVPITVDVTGAQQLTLSVDDGGDGNYHDHSDWGGAVLTCLS